MGGGKPDSQVAADWLNLFMVRTMARARLLRKAMPLGGLLCVALLGCALGLRAQTAPAGEGQAPDAPVPDAPGLARTLPKAPPAAQQPFGSAQRPPVAASLPDGPGPRAKGAGEETRQTRQQESGLTFSLWDRSPLDAIERSAEGRAERPATPYTLTAGFDSLQPGYSGLGRGAEDAGLRAGGMGRGRMGGSMDSGGMNAGRMGWAMSGNRGAQPGAVNLEMTRGITGVNLNSSAGRFSIFYQDALSSKSYGPAGGIGPGAAHATFTSTPFANGMFNFSSSLNYAPAGSGIGGTGIGGKKSTSSLSLKLRF